MQGDLDGWNGGGREKGREAGSERVGCLGDNVKKSLKKEGSLRGPLHRVERSVSSVVAPKREPFRIGSILEPESTRDGNGDIKHSPCHDTQLD